MKHPYSGAFSPPAPIVSVRLRSPGGSSWARADAMIDSGSDLCGFPEELARRLDLPPVRLVQAVGFQGGPMEVPVYRVDIELAGSVFHRMEALAIGRHYALVGRNVLRHLVVRLDGPKGQVELRKVRG